MGVVRRTISPHAARLRREMTDAERALWSRLRDRRLQGFKFRSQWTLGRYVADFCCLQARLVVEVDGGQHDEKQDARRTAWLKAQGFRVIRFWNNDVLTNIDGVLEVILEALEK
jgi:very-short-patch-repair endonuclease